MRFLLLSVTLHGAVWLWIHVYQAKDQKPLQPMVSSVDLLEAKTPTKIIKKTRQKKKGPGKKKVSLQSLMPTTLPKLKEFSSTSGQENIGDFTADNPQAQWGEGGGQFSRIRDYRKMAIVADHIDGIIGFPEALAYRHIGGVIRARLIVNHQGACDWKQTQIHGVRPELKFYVLSQLKHFCRNKTWLHLKKRKSSNIDFVFNFDLYNKKRSQPKILGNVVFYNLPGHQTKGNWKLGPLQGNYFVPNFIMLNPTWIAENWRQLMYDEDPMARFKKTKKDGS